MEGQERLACLDDKRTRVGQEEEGNEKEEMDEGVEKLVGVKAENSRVSA